MPRGRGLFRGRGVRGRGKRRGSLGKIDEKVQSEKRSDRTKKEKVDLPVEEPEDDSKSLQLDSITDLEEKHTKPKKKQDKSSTEEDEEEEESTDGSEGNEESEGEEESSEGTETDATTSGSQSEKTPKKKLKEKKKQKKKKAIEEKPKLSEKLKFSDNRIKENWKKKESNKKQDKTLERISSRIYSFSKKEDESSDGDDQEEEEEHMLSESENATNLKPKEEDIFKEESKKIERLEFIFSFLRKQTNQMRKMKRLTNDILKDDKSSQELKDKSKALQIELVRDLQSDMKGFVKESNNVLRILDFYGSEIERLYKERKITALSYHRTMAQLGSLYERRKALKDKLESI